MGVEYAGCARFIAFAARILTARGKATSHRNGSPAIGTAASISAEMDRTRALAASVVAVASPELPADSLAIRCTESRRFMGGAGMAGGGRSAAVATSRLDVLQGTLTPPRTETVDRPDRGVAHEEPYSAAGGQLGQCSERRWEDTAALWSLRSLDPNPVPPIRRVHL